MTKLNFMKKILLLTAGLLFGIGAFAQSLKVSGKVSEESGELLPGVNVIIKGTTTGVTTDFDGNYMLEIENPNNAVLQFSFIGFEPVEIPVQGKAKIDVVLKSSVLQLEEVVAVGYGTMKKRDLTGSVASVSSDEISKVPTANVATAIAGKVSGVQITSSEGSPDAGISIRVRGGGSITQDNSPLYVIDGFPSEDGINYLDPTDIETIDILKDASSAAIYGARGANGVVLITTKGGKVGKPRINFDAYFGIKEVTETLDVMKPYDFVKLQYENIEGDGDLESFENTYGTWDELGDLYKERKGIDWQDEMFGGNATIQNYKLSVTGGSKETKYSFSFSRNENEGIMVNSGFERNNGRLKIDQKVNDFIDASVIASYQEQKTYGMGTSDQTATFNKLTHIARYRPTIGKYGNDSDLIYLDEDPALVDDSGNVLQNPLVSSEAEHRETEKKQTTLNGSLKFNLTNDLYAKFDGGLRNVVQRRERFDGERSVAGKRNGGPFGSIQYDEFRDWNYALTLNYSKNIGNHDLNVLLGHEQVATDRKRVLTEVSGFPNDDIGLKDLGLGVPNNAESFEEETKLISFFGRVNYTFNNKYLFSATMRADGSSKFGPENKYGYFPSGSFGWRVSEEGFMQGIEQISNLKLRASYGVSGNNRIPNYGYMSILSGVTYGFDNTTQSGIVPENLANEKLKWESTHSANFGVDLGLFNQRVRVTGDFYLSRTKDLLLKTTIPATTGFTTTLKNIGETENKGMEFSVSTVNIKSKDFEWSTNFNISFNKNKIVKLADNQKFRLEESGWFGNKFTEKDYIVEVGRPIGKMYGYVWDGLYGVDDFNYDAGSQTYALKDGTAYDPNDVAQPGWMKYKDISGPNGVPDGKIDSNDRKVIGDANPIHFGGITNTFRYKNWDMSVFVNWSYGNDIYNANKMYYTRGFEKNKNVLALLKNRWSTLDAGGQRITDPAALAEMNKNAKYPVYNGNRTIRFHSGIVEDGSFLRINNITLGYNVPKSLLKRIKLDKVRIYGTANNIYTWTSYSGFDPEVSTRNATGLTPGVDWGAYPRSRTFIFGVNISM